MFLLALTGVALFLLLQRDGWRDQPQRASAMRNPAPRPPIRGSAKDMRPREPQLSVIARAAIQAKGRK